MNTQSIIFDCDGVLVDSEIIYNSVEQEHLARIGLHYEAAQYQERFLGLTQEDYLRQLNLDYLALDKGPFPEGFASTVKSECLKRFEEELVTFDGIFPVLKEFSESMAVASSSALELIHKKLKLTKLHKYFNPHIYSGNQVKKGKPSPDLFLYAASKLKQEPRNCIVIEDSINGVSAGVAAGMEVWGFIGGSHANNDLGNQLRQAGAIKTFSEYSELLLEL